MSTLSRNTPQPANPTKRWNRNVISGRASRRQLNHRVANRKWFGPLETSFAACPKCFGAHDRVKDPC